MRLNLRPSLRALAVSAALLAVPSLAGASFIVGPGHGGVSPDHGGRYNPISFNPTSVLINLQVNHSGTGSFKIIEPGFKSAGFPMPPSIFAPAEIPCLGSRPSERS